MNREPVEIGISHTVAFGRRPMRRLPQHTHVGRDATPADATSPAAMDEVFAMLARNVEQVQQPRAEVDGVVRYPSARNVGTIPSVPRSAQTGSVDASTLRGLGAEMDRQHERLAQLLRDIEGTDASQ